MLRYDISGLLLSREYIATSDVKKGMRSNMWTFSRREDMEGWLNVMKACYAVKIKFGEGEKNGLFDYARSTSLISRGELPYFQLFFPS